MLDLMVELGAMSSTSVPGTRCARPLVWASSKTQGWPWRAMTSRVLGETVSVGISWATAASLAFWKTSGVGATLCSGHQSPGVDQL